jgi:hypothetical protein
VGGGEDTMEDVLYDAMEDNGVEPQWGSLDPIEIDDPDGGGGGKVSPLDQCVLSCYQAKEDCEDAISKKSSTLGSLGGFCDATYCGCLTGCREEYGTKAHLDWLINTVCN